jgi:hypothetical protein
VDLIILQFPKFICIVSASKGSNPKSKQKKGNSRSCVCVCVCVCVCMCVRVSLIFCFAQFFNDPSIIRSDNSMELFRYLHSPSSLATIFRSRRRPLISRAWRRRSHSHHQGWPHTSRWPWRGMDILWVEQPLLSWVRCRVGRLLQGYCSVLAYYCQILAGRNFGLHLQLLLGILLREMMSRNRPAVQRCTFAVGH